MVGDKQKIIIDWDKFKANIRAKNVYIEFCEMLDEVDFELVSDYIGNKDNAYLVYKLDNDIKLNIRPNDFKT